MGRGSINFDENGYLLPYEGIEISMETLERIFVNEIPGSKTRKRLFNNYLDYTIQFQQKVFPYFEQWVNGSFVTHKPNPRDIDIVTFLDFEVFKLRESHLDQFLSFTLEGKGIDAYIVPVYPVGHSLHGLGERLKAQWLNRFSFAKADNEDRILPKGFVKIKFEK